MQDITGIDNLYPFIYLDTARMDIMEVVDTWAAGLPPTLALIAEHNQEASWFSQQLHLEVPMLLIHKCLHVEGHCSIRLRPVKIHEGYKYQALSKFYGKDGPKDCYLELSSVSPVPALAIRHLQANMASYFLAVMQEVESVV